MIAGKHDLLIQQGSSFELSITPAFDDGTDPMAYDYRAQLRAFHEDDTVLADFTINKGASAIVMSLASTVTEQIEATDLDKYVWDLEMFDEASGFVARILEGKVKVTPEVTR